MAHLKFLFLFSVMAGSSSTLASPTDNPASTQIQPEKVAVSSANVPMTTAKAKSEQYKREREQTAATAKRTASAEASRKSQAKKLASGTKTEIKHLILSRWQAPADSTGQKANARITLTSFGSIQSIVILDAPNRAFKKSIEKAILSSAPFDLPENPDARRESRLIYMSFHSK
ncbi:MULTISPECIES: TonB C-terminal domain-containing protein [unclassified Acinetobacter]|uniref:TonB C-terminal domain-containing protein n=1 Tax=unclassified Acinetobacter TaxID=196816 RepID=UPI00211DA878|nr:MULTISPECIES: TonB C-terminal domain-containing protein [unclassified Acinetobacter]UUS61671.1 TonB C-terminal domain-containing protein [Acinetobacter sp. YH16056_T]